MASKYRFVKIHECVGNKYIYTLYMNDPLIGYNTHMTVGIGMLC